MRGNRSDWRLAVRKEAGEVDAEEGVEVGFDEAGDVPYER